MLKDYFKFSFKTFKERPIRSWLTMLGIFIGIAALVSLVSLGQGLQAVINEQFQAMGTNKLMVLPAGPLFGFLVETSNKLTEHDLEIIKKVRGIELAGGIITKLAPVKSKEELKYTFIIGLPLGESRKIINDMQSYKTKIGRPLEKGDKYKALIGIIIKEGDFFKKEVNLRDKIEIEGQEFKVVGSLERIGNPQDDTNIYIPLETAREIFNEPDQLDMLFAQVQQGYDLDSVVGEVKEAMRKDRGLKKGEEDFVVQTTKKVMATYSGIFAVIQYALMGIVVIALLVGGIVIMNTMYTSVLQRTKEIGIMKAIGAKNRTVMLIFLIESGLLGLFGGAVGVALGIGISRLVELAAVYSGLTMLKAHFPWYLIVGALAFSFVVGVVSGVMPALKAAKLKLVDALRYE